MDFELSLVQFIEREKLDKIFKILQLLTFKYYYCKTFVF